MHAPLRDPRRATAAGAAQALLLAAATLLSSCDEPGPAPVDTVDADEVRTRLEARRGTPMLVNFWARWCKPCLAEFPELQAATEAIRGEGGDVVAVCLDALRRDDAAYTVEAAQDKVPRFLQRRDVTFEAWIYGSSDVQPLWDGLELPRPRRFPGSIPLTLALDADGKVVDFHEGQAGTEDFERLRSAALGMR